MIDDPRGFVQKKIYIYCVGFEFVWGFVAIVVIDGYCRSLIFRL